MNPSRLFHLCSRPSIPAGAAAGPQRWARLGAVLLWPLLLRASPAQASFLAEGALDTVANVMSWVVLFIAPLAGIGIFLLSPHPAGEDRREETAIRSSTPSRRCAWLSLVFGGMLWPIWPGCGPTPGRCCTSMAYGTGQVHERTDGPPQTSVSAGSSAASQQPAPGER